MTKPKWILFDLGGVVFDYRDALKDVSAHLGIEESLLLNHIIDHLENGELGYLSFEDAWKEILQTLQINTEPKFIIDIWWDLKRWVTNTRELIKKLHSNGYKLAVFTNNWKDMVSSYFYNIEEAKLFDHIFDSSEIHLRKPDKKFYEYVENKLNAHGQDILFIDDSPDNLKTARYLNWNTYLYALGDDNGKKSSMILKELLLG